MHLAPAEVEGSRRRRLHGYYDRYHLPGPPSPGPDRTPDFGWKVRWPREVGRPDLGSRHTTTTVHPEDRPTVSPLDPEVPPVSTPVVTQEQEEQADRLEPHVQAEEPLPLRELRGREVAPEVEPSQVVLRRQSRRRLLELPAPPETEPETEPVRHEERRLPGEPEEHVAVEEECPPRVVGEPAPDRDQQPPKTAASLARLREPRVERSPVRRSSSFSALPYSTPSHDRS